MPAFSGVMLSCGQGGRPDELREQVIGAVRWPNIEKADAFLDARPVMITNFLCPRNAGGRHDYFSGHLAAGQRSFIHVSGLGGAGLRLAFPARVLIISAR